MLDLLSWMPNGFLLAEVHEAVSGAAGDAKLISFASLLALLTLTALEIVLGIDNIVFITIVVNKLPDAQRKLARQLGLALAMGMRILLLLSIFWIMKLTTPLHPPIDAFWTAESGDTFALTGKDIVLIVGGLFLIWKSTHEIHSKLEGGEHGDGTAAKAVQSFGLTIVQILLLDLVFSLDSVITAVGMAQHIEIMITAVVISVAVMIAFSGVVARVIEKHPSLQVLALSFLLMIGGMLVIEGFGVHVPKGYIYFAMAFSVAVEMLNIGMKKKCKPVALHKPSLEREAAAVDAQI